MNKYILLIVLLFLVSGRIAAQSVTVDAKIDSLANSDGRTGESAITSSDGCGSRGAVFPSFYRYIGTWCGNCGYC